MHPLVLVLVLVVSAVARPPHDFEEIKAVPPSDLSFQEAAERFFAESDFLKERLLLEKSKYLSQLSAGESPSLNRNKQQFVF